MTKKERYKQNWQDFNSIILPELEKKYAIQHHNNAVKIFTNKRIYNYYPKGEKLNEEIRFGNAREYKWYKGIFTLQQFEERFIVFGVD